MLSQISDGSGQVLKAGEIERVWREDGYSAPPRRARRNTAPPATNQIHPAASFADAEAVKQFDQLLEMSGSMGRTVNTTIGVDKSMIHDRRVVEWTAELDAVRELRTPRLPPADDPTWGALKPPEPPIMDDIDIESANPFAFALPLPTRHAQQQRADAKQRAIEAHALQARAEAPPHSD
jgi:hypothetical protein